LQVLVVCNNVLYVVQDVLENEVTSSIRLLITVCTSHFHHCWRTNHLVSPRLRSYYTGP